MACGDLDQKGTEHNRPCGEEKSSLKLDFARGNLRCVDTRGGGARWKKLGLWFW